MYQAGDVNLYLAASYTENPIDVLYFSVKTQFFNIYSPNLKFSVQMHLENQNDIQDQSYFVVRYRISLSYVLNMELKQASLFTQKKCISTHWINRLLC